MRSSCGPENLRGRARECVFVLMLSFSQTDQRPVYSTSGSIFRESGILFSGLFGTLTNISLCWYRFPPPLPNILLTVCTYLYWDQIIWETDTPHLLVSLMSQNAWLNPGVLCSSVRLGQKIIFFSRNWFLCHGYISILEKAIGRGFQGLAALFCFNL